MVYNGFAMPICLILNKPGILFKCVRRDKSLPLGAIKNRPSIGAVFVLIFINIGFDQAFMPCASVISSLINQPFPFHQAPPRLYAGMHPPGL